MQRVADEQCGAKAIGLHQRRSLKQIFLRGAGALLAQHG
jgi:hypothetical protein